MTEAATLPLHLAIIMDGNGRWAAKRGKPRTYGHQAGAEAARRIVRAVAERNIGILTIYAFSSENWSRPKHEVRRLMSLFRRGLDRELGELQEHGVKLNFIGRREAFSSLLQRGMSRAERLTADGRRLMLNVAANYGGQLDIADAARRIAERVKSGEIQPDEVNEALLSNHRYLANQPAPDLFIRTGGERRLSNFLLWDLAYTELYFSDVLWPDFTSQHLDQALNWYASRQRRFGGLIEAEPHSRSTQSG